MSNYTVYEQNVSRSSDLDSENRLNGNSPTMIKTGVSRKQAEKLMQQAMKRFLSTWSCQFRLTERDTESGTVYEAIRQVPGTDTAWGYRIILVEESRQTRETVPFTNRFV